MHFNYKSVVFNQSANGLWTDKLYKLLGEKNIAELKAIQDSEDLKKLDEQVLLTLIALKVLNEKFSAKKTEWRLVAAKAKGCLKK